MYKRKTAIYKKLAHYGRTVISGLFSSSSIVSREMEIQMVNDGWKRERSQLERIKVRFGV